MLLRQVGYRTAFAGKFGFEVSKQPGGKDEVGLRRTSIAGAVVGPDEFCDGEKCLNEGLREKVAARDIVLRRLCAGFHSRHGQGRQAGRRRFVCRSALRRPIGRLIRIRSSIMFTPARNFPSRPITVGLLVNIFPSKAPWAGSTNGLGWDYDKDYDGVMAKYHQQIYAIDVAVGMIRDALNEHGVADNTVIIYTSDNGFLCGSHGYGSKVLPYEEASRVPLLMFDPRHKNSGKRLRCDSLTGNVDFAPTILELAGLSVPPNMDGRSLLKLYTDPEAETHAALPLINVWGPKAVHSYAVVTKDWKYIYWPYAEGELEAADELYHLAEDRLELNNVLRDSDARKPSPRCAKPTMPRDRVEEGERAVSQLQTVRHHLRSPREMGRKT